MDVATAHLVTARPDAGAEVLEAASRMLRERFHVVHATLQIETTDRSQCQGADW
jgi:cobalt-zinc-cadmium efflux system protein